MLQGSNNKKLSVGECNFWLNLGTLFEKRGSKLGSEEESEKINNWLSALLKGDKE